MQQQLLRQIRAAVYGGQTPAGTPMPSTRDVSVKLGLGSATVQLVYSAAMAEGLLLTRKNQPPVVAPESLRPSESARLELLKDDVALLVTKAKELKLPTASLCTLINHLAEHK